MNKKYIKRQITLHKIGVPIDNSIQKYYDNFHRLIGNIDCYDKTIQDRYDYTVWRNEGMILFEYYSNLNLFIVDYDIIWKRFMDENKPLYDGTIKENSILYDEMVNYLMVFLEDFFKVNINTIDSRSRGINNHHWDIVGGRINYI